MSFRLPFTGLFSGALLGTALCSASVLAESLALLPQVEVDSQGVFGDKLFSGQVPGTLAGIRFAPAPPWGEVGQLSRAQVSQLLAKVAPNLAVSLAGAPEVRILRRVEKLNEKELLERLSKELAPGSDRDRAGELELRFTRDWKPLTVPADNYELRILDKPATGLAPSFMVRFEIRSNSESIGIFAVSLQARYYRDVWVARTAIRAKTAMDKADLVRERRDVINYLREPAWTGEKLDSAFQVKEPVAAGGILYDRAVKRTPVVKRGDVAQATVLDGVLTVSTKVEVLEEGAPGDLVRARNIRTKKEVRGKVTLNNEGTVEIMF